jgi:hypothetical protein
MLVAQAADHLAFNDDLVLAQEVGGIFANDYVIAKDDDSLLLDGAEAGLPHLVGKGIFGKLFNEPKTERIGSLKGTPNDPLGHRQQYRASPASICIPLIRLKKPALATVPTPDRAGMSYPASANEP